MKSTTLRYLTGMALMLLSAFALAAGPVALLTQVKGSVEYSKDGETWKPVTRNKLLKSGYQIRSGVDGAGLLVNQVKGTARSMGSNTQVRILDDAIELVAGDLGEPREGNDLMGTLRQRFAQVQRHTTVRRAVQRPDQAMSVRLSTAKRITLSNNYPDLVWQSVGADYSYRLNIGDNHYPVPASAEGMVRFSVPVQAPGEHNYSVDVMQGETVVYSPRRPSTLKWLSDEESGSISQGLSKLRDEMGDDDFFIATYLSDQGLEVPAMDHYREYFSASSDNNDLRPLLIASYHALKLSNLRLHEAQIYNEALAE